MEEFKKSGTSTSDVVAATAINSSLKTFEGKTNDKPVFKNVVTNQKDITIDLSVFLEDPQTRKFFKSDQESEKGE